MTTEETPRSRPAEAVGFEPEDFNLDLANNTDDQKAYGNSYDDVRLLVLGLRLAEARKRNADEIVCDEIEAQIAGRRGELGITEGRPQA